MATGTAAPDADAGSMAWMLGCGALVQLMTPGLAFFYGEAIAVKTAAVRR